MVPYFVMVLVPYALFFAFDINDIKPLSDARFSRRITVTSFFLLLIFLLAFRDVTCGTDLVRYEEKFMEAGTTAWSEVFVAEKDVGYYVFQKLIRSVTSHFGFFLALVAVLSLAPIWFFYRKEVENPILAIALFITVAPFTMYFSGLRQILAMALVIPAWYCAKHKKWWLFILTVLVTAAFHSSGCIIALIYPLYHARITKKWLLLLTPTMLLVLVLNKPLFRMLLSLVGDSGYEMTDTGAYTVLILLVLFTAYSFIIPDEATMDADTAAMRNILVLSVFLQCFAPVHTLAMRVNYYFLLFIPVLIPRIAHRAKPVWIFMARLSVAVMTVFFTVWFFLQGYLGADELNVFPYVFRYA
ncbi:MAG: EpsG family protein [Clostridia bacterium]|nr:EpsG family protein [Clostridia bacterium]